MASPQYLANRFMTYHHVMGFFDRVNNYQRITDEQARQLFRQDEIEVVAICEVLMSPMYGPFGYLVQFANGTGGFFGYYGGFVKAGSPEERLSLIHHNGLHHTWRKGWGLVEEPKKLDFKAETSHSWFKRDPKNKKVIFDFIDHYHEIDDAWSFWEFKFYANTNSIYGATTHSFSCAINGRGIDLETLLKSIPVV